MTRPLLYIEDDLSDVRLAVQGKVERPPDALLRPEQTEDADPLQGVVRQAAALARWTAERVTGPLTVCTGVKRALCERVRAPSAAPLVVQAALAERSEEEANRIASLTIEPIAPARPSRHRRGDSAPAASPVTVLELPTAAIRLVLDELDGRGLPCVEAITLWHATLRATFPDPAPPSSTTAADHLPLRAVVVSSPPSSVIWAFGKGAALMAGGAAQAPTAAAAASRLLLDWMSWCAQLEAAPEHTRVLGPWAGDLADLLRNALPEVQVDAAPSPDPLDQTLAILSTREIPLDDPPPSSSVRLTSLTTRPSRRHRAAALWLSAAAALLAAAGVLFSLRAYAWKAELSRQTTALRQTIRQQAVEAVAPSPLPPGDTVRAVLASLEESRQAFDPPQPPPPPLAIRQELAKLFDAVAAVPEAKLARANLEKTRTGDPRGSAMILIPSLEAGEKVQLAIQEKTRDGGVRWTGRFLGSPPALRLQLTAQWEPSP
ncbi:MAG: hypothetical protein D6824_01575 [Planctomycetota bacterium]|nr:MAG: hypothetical protein D6824_01575 [Planctomycetota bacterium]